MNVLLIMGVILVSWVQQTFNDALYFCEKAELMSDDQHPFEYWRNCTWSIISSVFCMEGYLLSFISSRLHELDDDVANVFDNSKLGFDNKIDILEQVLDLQLSKGDSDWNNIRKMIYLRNEMAHFSRSNIFNDINLVNAKKTIKACKDLIKKLHASDGSNYKKGASWIDATESKNIDSGNIHNTK